MVAKEHLLGAQASVDAMSDTGKVKHRPHRHKVDRDKPSTSPHTQSYQQKHGREATG